MHLNGSNRARWSILAPQRVCDPLRADGLVRVEQEDRQDGARLCPRHVDGTEGVVYL